MGANIAGFKKVADAMMAQGIVQLIRVNRLENWDSVQKSNYFIV